MSEIITNKHGRNDEIDLFDLFNRIGRTLIRWGLSLGQTFLVSVVFLLKSWLPLGLSVATGMGVAFIMKSTSHSIYTSDMVLRSNVIETSEMISYINRIQTFDKQTLSKTLYIPIETCNNISNIGAFWIIDNNKDRIPDYVDYANAHDIYDTTNIRMQGRFDIRVTTYSAEELNYIRDGILKFIESDSLFQQRNRVRLIQNFELITRFNSDIKQIDSLQKVKYLEESRKKNSQIGGQIIFLQQQNAQLFYNDVHYLYTRKQPLESERYLYKEIVTILSDFSLPISRVNGLSYFAKKVVPVFFILTLIVLVLYANWKKLEDIYNRY